MSSRLYKIVISLFLLITLARTSYAQDSFQPIPLQQAAKYRLNFARNFFPSPQVEQAERKKVYAMFTEIEKLKGKLTKSADNLLLGLDLSDKSTAEMMRHAVYLYLRYATNTKDSASRDAQTKLFADQSARLSFMQQEIMRLAPKTEAKFVAERPALKKYAFVIESSRRLRPHTLSLKEEELFSNLSPVMNDWQAELYQNAIDKTTWGTVHTETGDVDVRKQEGAWRNSPDRAVREVGFKKYAAAEAAARDLYAFALIKTIKSRNEQSQLHHFKDYPEDSHFNLFLTTPQVKGLFERIAQQGDYNKRYQRLRADHIKKISGLDEVKVWDMTVVPKGVERPRFTIDEANAAIKAALSPFGVEYIKELSALLNPANGRIDIAPGENRVPGAFSWGFPGSQIGIFYSYNYEGFYNDVSTLAHEAGHVVHFQFMANNHVIPSYTNGPTYFTESFAMFNELLLADYLYQKEKSNPSTTNHQPSTFKQTYFLEQFLNQAMGSFGITRQAAIEQAAYDGVEAGKINTADDLDAMVKKLGSRTSIWYERQDELKMEWIDVHHYYTQPMYYVNYVFANFLALKYYQMYKADPKGFIPKYIALVHNGFDAPPSVLLKKFLGLSLEDPTLVSDAFSVVDGKIKALEALYAQDQTSAAR